MFGKGRIVSMLLFGLMILPATGSAQQWAWTYGDIQSDRAVTARELTGSGHIVAGTTGSSGAGQNDIWLLQLDTTGLVAWEKTCGGTGNDSLAHMQQT